MSLTVVRSSSRPRLCLLVVLLALQSCSRNGHGGDYYPLVPGSQWQYRLERTTMDGARELRYATSIATPLANEPADLRTRVTLDGQRFLYRVTSDGTYRVGVQRRSGPHLAEDDQPQMVMPAHPSVGQQWQVHSATSVLESSAPPWESLFRVQVPLALRYRIVDLHGEIRTPAGAFDHCVVIEGEGHTEADLGNGIGPTTITVRSREWYAPGVGLVRMERDEHTNAKPLNGGALVMELDGWSQP